MKNATTLILLALATLVVQAQDAYHNSLLAQLQTDYGVTGGSWIFGNTEAGKMALINSYGVTVTEETVSGQDFSLAKNVLVNNPGTNSYSNALILDNVNAINSGDLLLLSLWVKGISGQNGGNGILKIVVERAGPPYEQQLDVISQNADTWTQYLFPFESIDSYAAGEMHLSLQVGFEAQELQIAGIALLNYGTNYTLEELPQKNFRDYYAGIEAAAPWRAPASSRIEQHRKANLNLEIVDDQGNPLPNATVSLDMESHEFAFGSAVNSTLFAGNSGSIAAYQNVLNNMDGQGHGFNMVVFENDLKWDAWEGNWPGSVAEKENAANWLANQDIRLRGHTLVWPGWQYMPDYMLNSENDPATLMQHIDVHLQDILGTPFVNNYVEEWDVLNEITTNRDLENAFAGYQSYVTGREIYPETIDKAYTLAPNAKRYINDYMTITSGGLNTSAYNRYKDFLTEIDNSTDFDGIGFQAHINNFPVAPQTVYDILDDFYTTYGKEMKITEFDMAGVNPSIGYEYMRDFLTMTFSHPGCNGFLAWGFWDGAHWYDNAPFYDIDWNLKPGGQAFVDLVFNEWWTNETGQTSATGELAFRAFKGKHLVTVSQNGITEVHEIVLGDDQTLQIVLDGQGGCLIAGTPCDDSNPNTEEDLEDGRCNCLGTAIQEDACNLLVNGKFIEGISDWNNWGATAFQNNGEVFIEIPTTTANPWNIGFVQTGLFLEQGKTYELTFDARASVNRDVNIKFGMAVAPYSTYYGNTLPITTTMTSYSQVFTASNSDTNAQFEFHLGEFAGDVYLDNILLREVGCGETQANFTVFLEGCYDIATGKLLPTLNNLGLLPGQANNMNTESPYATAPWNYTGTETENFDAAAYTAIEAENGGQKVVDWLLVTFRTDITAATNVGQKLAIVLEDGRLVFPEAIDFLEENTDYFVVIEHWSHMAALSPSSLLVASGQITQDFTTQDSYRLGLGASSKELNAGIWGLYGGNCAQTPDFPGYDTNGLDKQLWTEDNGSSNSYNPTDLNMDGDVNGADRMLWEANNGLFVEVD